MRRRYGVLAGGLLVIGAGVGLAATRSRESGFPHARHERLFPVCEGCHAGIVTGDTAEVFPDAADCAQCHDGQRAKRVSYDHADARASTLRFSHVVHDRGMAGMGQEVACQACHAAADGPPSRMNVAGPRPDLCAGCHAHRTEPHLSPGAACTQCHLPLADARRLSAAQIDSLPRPAWHDTPEFPLEHGQLAAKGAASCTVCHARRTCERCHANAPQVGVIAALQADARVDSLEHGKAAAYPKPASHRDAAWRTEHGAAARAGVAACANCHTRPSCSACHGARSGTAAAAVASLPDTTAGRAQGVQLARGTRMHPPDIATRHGVLAGTGALQCTECHAPPMCASCHAGSDSRAFHAPNFVERHAVDVFSASVTCQSCHSTETFCRDCHASAGVAAQRGMSAAFHTGQPMWVLSHGTAARTGMEACASCHRQTDCVQCHSAVGGWRVDPHGPGFPASRLNARNASSCRWCHSTGTPGGT